MRIFSAHRLWLVFAENRLHVRYHQRQRQHHEQLDLHRGGPTDFRRHAGTTAADGTGDIARANAYMFEQIAGDRMLKALALVTR